MSGTISYVFYAIEKPLSRAQRAEVTKLLPRVAASARRADFFYNIAGQDLPVAYESLLAKYYDLMIRQSNEQWTCAMAWDYESRLHKSVAPFACNDGAGCGVRVEPMDADYTRMSHKVVKPTRLLAEITAFLDYDAVESIKGLRDLAWERASEEEEEDWEDEYYEGAGDWEANLAQLTNCIREDALKGDVRAFYLAWDKFRDRALEKNLPEPPAGLNTLPLYLKQFSRMLLSQSER